jgi:four helix bundle protein
LWLVGGWYDTGWLMEKVENSRNWKDLVIWQESHSMALQIYALTRSFPKEEQFNIVNQIRRAVISIPTNIVEGHSKGSKKEFVRFLYISRGSLEEVKYLLLLSNELGYISNEDFETVSQRLSKLGLQINNFIKYLNSAIKSP